MDTGHWKQDMGRWQLDIEHRLLHGHGHGHGHAYAYLYIYWNYSYIEEVRYRNVV
jgi:hypothetical protein